MLRGGCYCHDSVLSGVCLKSCLQGDGFLVTSFDVKKARLLSVLLLSKNDEVEQCIG